MKSITLAHYYTTPEVQALADYVGDSLDLAMKAVEEQPDEIVFAGVRFMAETAKILNPKAKVILPDKGSTCSLVEQTNTDELRRWVELNRMMYAHEGKEVVHVAYINSSAEHKALADIIVTSRIVNEVINELYAMGKEVIFSPDRNMGEYINNEYSFNMPVWTAVCEVHDKFAAKELEKEMMAWTDGPKVVLAHPESPLPILRKANYVGSTHGMLKWIKELRFDTATVWVATEEGLLYNMRKARPELDIRQAPTYTGCKCNQCPYMKLNTEYNVSLGAEIGLGEYIDYLTEEQMDAARLPIERMIHFQKTGEINV